MGSGMDIGKQIEFFERKCRLNPDSRSFAPLADLYRRAGRLEDALRILEEGLAAHPRYISALVILGRCHLDRGEGAKAREVFRQVLDVDPDNLVVLKLLAEDAAGREDWGEASGLLERVVLLDPSDEPAEAELAALRERRHRDGPEVAGAAPPAGGETPPGFDVDVEPVRPPRPAEDYLLRPRPAPAPPPAEEPAGDDAPRSLATRTLAEIYLAQGYRDKALEVLREILMRHPDRADIRAQIAELEREDAGGEPAAAGTEGPSPAPRSGARSRRQFESWIDRISHPADDER